jgi:very-short-patch-repair endonuclease
MSYPEVLLWQRLRGSPMGIKFRRQHPVGPDYAVDFYCAAARLAIEVDGEIHATPGAPEHDARRDAYLHSHGVNVVRVPARDILRDANGAADAIVALASTPLHHRASRDGPPPRAGEDQGRIA